MKVREGLLMRRRGCGNERFSLYLTVNTYFITPIPYNLSCFCPNLHI